MCARAANSAKLREKMGSSEAYKTMGTFLSQKMRQKDARVRATDRCNAAETQRYAKGRH